MTTEELDELFAPLIEVKRQAVNSGKYEEAAQLFDAIRRFAGITKEHEDILYKIRRGECPHGFSGCQHVS